MLANPGVHRLLAVGGEAEAGVGSRMKIPHFPPEADKAGDVFGTGLADPDIGGLIHFFIDASVVSIVNDSMSQCSNQSVFLMWNFHTPLETSSRSKG